MFPERSQGKTHQSKVHFGPWYTSAVFFMFFVQSKHQQILHFDFESSQDSLYALLMISNKDTLHDNGTGMTYTAFF
ncbi:hypothetical protein HMPREF2140_04700 [Hoylesella buccalis DNF00985]|nr:hypothetical protein HMPREF2140_04700 [Hoylesella buccalis DNF00985]